MEQWIDGAYQLGDKVMRGLGLTAYAVAMEVGDNQKVSDMGLPRWLNLEEAVAKELTKTSLSPMVAMKKAGELMARRPTIAEGDNMVTPCVNDARITEMRWRGGVRIGRRIIAISALPQEHDELVAAVMHAGGSPRLRPEFVGMGQAIRHGKPVPVVRINTPHRQDFVAFVGGVCKVPIEESGPFGMILFVEKGGDDAREPGTIGLAAVDKF